MNVRYREILTIIQLICASQSISNGILDISWISSSSKCYDIIYQHLQVRTILGNTDPSLQQQYACMPNGDLFRIMDCENLIDRKIQLISYFYSLPENDASKQCICQSRCINLRESHYTMKFYVQSTERYFTTCLLYTSPSPRDS